jgi:hypothetical protein
MRWVLLTLLAVLGVAGLAAGAPPAYAHGVSDTADLQLAQTFAGNDLTVVVRRTPKVPGPLYVDVIAHRPVRATTLVLGVRATTGVESTTDTVRLVANRPGTYRAELAVAQAGEHELTLVSGARRAAIPFRVLVPRLAVWEPVAYGGLAATGLLLAGALGTAALGRGRGLRLALVQGGAGVVALTVAVTAAGLSRHLPPAQPDGAAPAARADPADGSAPLGRPFANLAARTEPERPRTGMPFTLVLELTDGSTGRPIDDLVAHHAALAHTVVTSTDGAYFRHLHPVRVAPGRLEVELTPERPGRHQVHVELERADSGAQLLTASFVAFGPSRPASHARPSAGVTIRTLAPPVAGRATTVDVDVAANDLQPWLGMAGHLVLRDEKSSYFAHVHELTSMIAQANRQPGKAIPDETVAQYGPRLRFVFSFPRPGRYRAWLQYVRDFEVITVPFDLVVRPASPPGSRS